MKKLFMLAAAVVMASGVFGEDLVRPDVQDAANKVLYQNGNVSVVGGVSGDSKDYPYTWTVTLTDVADPSSLPMLTAYLVNTKATQDQLSGTAYDYNGGLSVAGYDKTAGYYVYTSMVIDDSNKDDKITTGAGKVLATKTFKSTSEITYTDANLATVLIATDAQGNELGRQTLLTTYSSQSDHTTFGANGTYTATNVPEPTSGLLMLLGMAGLALKRKCA